MSEQLDRIENSSVDDPAIQKIIDAHLDCINSPLKLVSGRRFNAEPNDPPAFSRGIYIAGVPLGAIYVSDQLYEKLNSDELLYIVLHEICHIINNNSAANFLFELGKAGFNLLLSKWTNLPLEAVEDILGNVKTIIKEFGYPGIEEHIRRSQELEADKYAVVWMGKKEPAISALIKMVQGKMESISHVTRYGRFEFPVLTIKERIEAINQLKI
ncbi:MAG: M48 family metalloprotease [Candidatus Jordarchaeaceae archaeon]